MGFPTSSKQARLTIGASTHLGLFVSVSVCVTVGVALLQTCVTYAQIFRGPGLW